MALETLKDIKEIGGFKVAVMDDLKKTNPELFGESGQMDYKVFERDFRPKYPIQIRHDKNSISFTIQNGPIKEVGQNGCQLITLVETAVEILKGVNEKFPSRVNAITLTKWEEGLHWQYARTKDREKRNVEGKSLK